MVSEMVVFYITERAKALGERLLDFFPEAEMVRFSAQEVRDRWAEVKAMVFIMATGIVVRTVASLLQDKKTDPAILVLDEEGSYVISLAGGHLGGANDLARQIAGLIGARPVITTASDLEGLPSLDLWAKRYGLEIENPEVLPQVMGRFIKNGALRIFYEEEIPLPDEFIRVLEPRYADVIVTVKEDIYLDETVCPTGGCKVKGQVLMRPRRLVVGIGFNKGTDSEELLEVLQETFHRNNLSLRSLSLVATLDRKAEEEGFKGFVQRLGVPYATYSVKELNASVRTYGLEVSRAAERATGALAVAEPAAVLGSKGGRLIVPKVKKGNVTLAIALRGPVEGKLYIVGTGPGAMEDITPRARKALREAEVVVGYGPYLERIAPLIGDKEIYSTGMTKELDRCQKALEEASKGRVVALISGGDPGIYAMAGPVFELMKTTPSLKVAVEVIPGLSALNAVASRLGAPLMNDFAVVSLSDRLTPWQAIERRLERAAEGDFVIVLFNPRSKSRTEHLRKALEIISRYRTPETPVGIVKAALRETERVTITSLACVPVEEVDMETTLIVGNSRSFVYEGFMVTPRGYGDKYGL